MEQSYIRELVEFARPPGFVEIADRRCLQLADSRVGRLEHERRERVGTMSPKRYGPDLAITAPAGAGRIFATASR